MGQSARDLVRKRSSRARPPDTGRMHHIGAAPEAVPVHTEDGVTTTRSQAWQLADRTVLQLQRQADDARAHMHRAAAAMDFEGAASRRDELAAVEAELASRS